MKKKKLKLELEDFWNFKEESEQIMAGFTKSEVNVLVADVTQPFNTFSTGYLPAKKGWLPNSFFPDKLIRRKNWLTCLYNQPITIVSLCLLFFITAATAADMKL